MKVYPKTEKDLRKISLGKLPKQDDLLRRIAILIAFLSVFVFVIKILFL